MMMNLNRFRTIGLPALLGFAGLLGSGGESFAARASLCLDGQWEIADSISPDEMPKHLEHIVPVPGMVNLAKPAFPDVDKFDSKELIANNVRKSMEPRVLIVLAL